MQVCTCARSLSRCITLGGLLLALHSTGAIAGIIQFNDVTDTLTITDTTGRATTSACGISGAGAEVCSFAWNAPVGVVSASGGPVGSFNIFESVGNSIVSDQLIWDFGFQGGTATFISDLDVGGLVPIAGAFSLTESGGSQVVGGVTWILQDGTSVTDTIQFVSDVESVPEPASLALVGIALAGLALARRQGIQRQR